MLWDIEKYRILDIWDPVDIWDPMLDIWDPKHLDIWAPARHLGPYEKDIWDLLESWTYGTPWTYGTLCWTFGTLRKRHLGPYKKDIWDPYDKDIWAPTKKIAGPLKKLA